MKDSIRFIGNLIFIIILFGVLFSYAMFQGGFVSWFLFYSFLPILFYHFGLLFYPMNNWKVTRELSRHIIQAGDDVTITLTFNRSFPFPLYYCVFEEIIPESLLRRDSKHHKYHYMDQPEVLNVKRSMKKIIFAGFRKSIKISYTFDQVPRGEHQLEGVRVLTSDVLGFVKKEHIFTVKDELIVYPVERDIRLTEGISSFEQGTTAVNAFHLENTNVATGVRKYAPGDRFSWIHWKQTARSNTVMTKEFEQERSTDLLLILDACASKRSNPLAFEAAVELTLSLITRLERIAVDVGLLAIGEETMHFQMKQDSMMREKVKNYLTRIQPKGERPFPIILKERMRTLRQTDRLVIITTNIDDFYKQTIQELRLRTQQVVVYYIQSSRFIYTKEKEIISQMTKEGIPIYVLTEKQLVGTPLEVSIK